MAEYKTLEYILNEYEQEEKVETRQVSGVTEEILVQEYCHVVSKLILTLKQEPEQNHTKINAEIKVFCTAGEKGEGFTLSNYSSGNSISLIGVSSFPVNESYRHNYVNELNKKIPAGASYEFSLCYTSAYMAHFTHLIDGTKNINISADSSYSISGVTGLGDSGYKNFTGYIGQDVELPTLDRSTKLLTASNFTDEENPTITYNAINGSSIIPLKYDNGYYTHIGVVSDHITSLKACISFDGITPDIAYREIPTNANSYTFNLTDAEREVIRNKVQGANSKPVYFITKTIRDAVSPNSSTQIESAEFTHTVERIVTIVGADVIISPTVKDIKLETLALTGNENTFIRYESMAEYAINATASKNATIVSQSVQCGSKTIMDLPNGVIEDVESGTFIFNAVDSRNMGASASVFKNLVEYVKPTCNQKLEISLSGETGAVIALTVSGKCFNGSFGVVDNNLLLEVRYTDDNGEFGDWVTLNGSPAFDGNTYELQTTFSGFSYGNAYEFQCRATDRLNFVISSTYIIRLLPIFDWSEADFNFNVPVNIGAEDLKMNGNTIIRHSKTTKNTVLSASKGNIYIRPNGTDNTSGETIFYGNGKTEYKGIVDFNDNANFNGLLNIGDYALDDFVIETGSESMGSNGTWYWRKWKSGKSECWGCRNFGNMAVTTAWGNLYRSAIFTQDLPEDVFIRTPDSININIVHGGYGGWICKHEQTAPSAITTGSFIYVRPASATLTPSNIGFYIIGEWI